ncbi:MAG: septal ring lytic transglycosylase RlpA family protein [Proteobacteria bacterium]|nr:septal ring lytic transglycosylase RlpA family protein [Pseudomonadota bacterium]
MTGAFAAERGERSTREKAHVTKSATHHHARRHASHKARHHRHIARHEERSKRRSASWKSKRRHHVAARSDEDRPQRRHRHAYRGDGESSGGTVGMASYYWEPQALASGGRFNPNALTAAHKTLPFGTRVRVTHLGNGRSVNVVINDRGPYVGGRIIDLSKAAASAIAMTGQGVARIRMTVLGR